MNDIKEDLNFLAGYYREIRARMGDFIVGNEALVELCMIGLLSGGHILVEGIPGTMRGADYSAYKLDQKGDLVMPEAPGFGLKLAEAKGEGGFLTVDEFLATLQGKTEAYLANGGEEGYE